MLTVTRATPDQVPLVYELVNDAARRLVAQNVDQWPHPYPEHIVRRSFDRTYVAWQGDQPVGSLAIYWDDPTFWGEQPPDAGYVHRLVVAHHARGAGLGARMLDWAGEHIAGHGRPWVRLDCGAVNAPLRAFYEREGFKHVRDVEVGVRGAGAGDVWRASLYQRPSV